MSAKVNRPLSGANRRLVILEQAVRLFRERGYLSTTLRKLASRSGIQGGSIYHHFASKQEILFEIMDRTMTRLIDKLEKKIASHTDPMEKLKEAIRFHIEYHVVDADETNVTDSELRYLEKDNYHRIVIKRKEYEEIFIRILKEGIDQEQLFIDNIRLTCKAIIQLCTSVSYWFKQDGPLTIQEVAEKYIEFICWGVTGKGNKDV